MKYYRRAAQEILRGDPGVKRLLEAVTDALEIEEELRGGQYGTVVDDWGHTLTMLMSEIAKAYFGSPEDYDRR
jgi:hypothetical protein